MIFLQCYIRVLEMLHVLGINVKCVCFLVADHDAIFMFCYKQMGFATYYIFATWASSKCCKSVLLHMENF
jgi:hypothetical protein